LSEILLKNHKVSYNFKHTTQS